MITAVSKSPAITKKIAQELARTILSSSSKGAYVILLFGELGAGKTTFTKGFMRGASLSRIVQSPTFILQKKYPILKKIHSQFRYIIHIDLYRLKKAKELAALDFYREIENPENIVLIEWPEKIRNVLVYGTMSVTLKHVQSAKERRIVFRSIKHAS